LGGKKGGLPILIIGARARAAPESTPVVKAKQQFLCQLFYKANSRLNRKSSLKLIWTNEKVYTSLIAILKF